MPAQKLTLTPVPAFEDNYIWCLTDTEHGSMVVVDPGDADPVIAFAQQANKTISHILITHHHWDHTDGIEHLLQIWPEAIVYGPAAEATKIPALTHPLVDGDQMTLQEFDLTFKVLHVPGHTLGHIAYYALAAEQGPILLCGDTLFSGGCGRLFEGSPAQMHQSLQRLAQLPDDTKVYCTHEYTLANLAFARHVEPANQALIGYQAECKQLRANQLPTLPSSIALEKAINPFLRCEQPSLQQLYQSKQAVNVFRQLRQHKDEFKS
ncbi:MAG: hydroxyacylglutathione hydrolase [Alkalimonas sp.]|nr:hydroxyacylglutathione hydrolase [Alkalimonas sp.]